MDVRVGSLLQPLGVTGVCEWEAGEATAADTAAIALGGPAATLVGLVATAALLGRTAPGSLAHAFVWQATAVQAFALVFTLAPLRYGPRDGSRGLPSDGAIVVDALRHGALSRPRLGIRVPDAPALPLPTTASSPLCAVCGHRRDEHVDLVTGRSGGCLGQDYDFQTLTPSSCTCKQYVHVALYSPN